MNSPPVPILFSGKEHGKILDGIMPIERASQKKSGQVEPYIGIIGISIIRRLFLKGIFM